jgi:homoserine dehydrogenase
MNAMSATLPMKPIQVGLLGAGTVGSGTFKVLQRNQEEIKRRAGRGIEITMVADLDTARAREVAGEGVKVVADAREVIANPDIDIVIELIGGYGIAKQLVLEAMRPASTWSPPTRRCSRCTAPRSSRPRTPRA